jgi:N-acetylglucosaminyl-diphospho-decaprenol L-rhamnosyltransferase
MRRGRPPTWSPSTSGCWADVPVAIVVVTYRSATHIAACLDAIAAAAAPAVPEVLVVDNASDDGTAEWLAARMPAERLILNTTNRGFAAAVHQAAGRVPGADLLLLNPDAVPEPGAIAVLVEELARDSRIGAVGARLLNLDGSPQPSAWREPDAWTLAFEALLLYNLFPRSPLHCWEPAGPDAQDVACLSGACLLVRRECWQRTGGFDERFFLYFEDFDFCVRARRAGFRLRLAPRARARHELGGSAFQDRRVFRRRFHESRRIFLRTHHARLGGAALVLIDRVAAATRWAADTIRSFGTRP